MELIANGISKTIGGRNILSNISLELKSGMIYGFVGRNGSGKTMLFRALSGLITTSSGTISFDGKQMGKDFYVLPNLGIVIENVGLYPDLTGVENLQYLANLRKRIGISEIKNALVRVGLDPQDKRSFRKYSLGMKQRLAIAQAIMEKPDVIMLDEPTNGLDEDGVVQIRQVIFEEKSRGALILLTSHSRDDIKALADVVYHIDGGMLSI
ncbi:MAG: ATP-binding cassette domain-containing protein [Dysosmobacter sp.]|nr:ATP-binding cassette domain-containing protein [Dysosmobacter sp.]